MKHTHFKTRPEKGLISSKYHRVFLRISSQSFYFALVVAAATIVFIFLNPDKYGSAGVIASISALGFFYSKWSQKTYVTLLREANKTDKRDVFINDQHVRGDKELLSKLIDLEYQSESVGRNIKRSEIDEY